MVAKDYVNRGKKKRQKEINKEKRGLSAWVWVDKYLNLNLLFVSANRSFYKGRGKMTQISVQQPVGCRLPTVASTTAKIVRIGK